jgi:hypothetical protein
MESPTRTRLRRDVRRRATRRRALGVLAACGAVATAVSAGVVLPAVTGTTAAFTDDAYLNLAAAGGKPIGTETFNLKFRYRTGGAWSSGVGIDVSPWMEADQDGGVDVVHPVNCTTPLRPQADASGRDACRAEIHVANVSPRLSSTLQVQVQPGAGSDAAAASAVRYAVYSAFPYSSSAAVHDLEASGRALGDTVTIRGSDPSTTLLGPAGSSGSRELGRLEFVFYLADQGPAANAAVVGKSVSLNITLHGRSVVSP